MDLGDYVLAGPITAYCGEVMGRSGNSGEFRKFSRSAKTITIALEIEYTARQHVSRRHALAKPGRHGTEILADQYTFVALALERGNSEQIIERKAQIGAVGCRRT